jgi:FtsH-binding integral membrane protein
MRADFRQERSGSKFRREVMSAVDAGLLPVTIGLVGASALVVARTADHDWTMLAITLAAAALAYWAR